MPRFNKARFTIRSLRSERLNNADVESPRKQGCTTDIKNTLPGLAPAPDLQLNSSRSPCAKPSFPGDSDSEQPLRLSHALHLRISLPQQTSLDLRMLNLK